MAAEHAESCSLEDAVANDIELESNAFLLLHSWAAGAQLLDFVEKAKGPLAEKPMTAAELAKTAGMNEGPLAIMLRTCCILGYASFDSAQGTYSLVQGVELEELEAHLAPNSNCAQALRGIYAEVMPPFKISSPESLRCLEVWGNIRPSWRNSKSKALGILLDGIVVAPILASITYYEHWGDKGQNVQDENEAPLSLDFSSINGEHRAALESMLSAVKIGSMSDSGTCDLPSDDWDSLQQARSYFEALSHAPLMAKFQKVLTEEPSWGFKDADDDDAEEGNGPVREVLRQVGKGIVEKPMFWDLMRHIDKVFGGKDFASQPKAIMDVGSTNGQLLVEIFQHVKDNLPRGQNLDTHPLLMISIADSEEKRTATAVNLAFYEVPHLILKGQVMKPAEILAGLKKNSKKKKIEPKSILHVRAFQDHSRAFIAPKNKLADDGPMALYAKEQMGDFVHLDEDGKPIEAVTIFASAVEHFQRWATATEGSFGVCMLEEMMLDISTSKRFLNDSLAFSSNTIGALARQYKISAGAFCMAGAMAGLFPSKYDQVQNYPEQGQYTLVLNQHLVHKPFTLRFAELSDLPELVRLEEVGWAPNLRKGEEQLKRRLETSPTTCYVCAMGGKIIAALYAQRVASLDAIDSESRASDKHDPAGRVLQLLALVADTAAEEVKKLGIDLELLSFVLHLARMDAAVDFVCGVTRCGDFKGEASAMQDYVDKHLSEGGLDSILGFHTGYGAKVVKLVPDWRPEDTDNHGIGVLIRYDVKSWKAAGVREEDDNEESDDESDLGGEEEEGDADPLLGKNIVWGLMSNIGFPLADKRAMFKPFPSLGLDSIDLVRIRNRMGRLLGHELPTTLLLDYPCCAALADFLDKKRNLGAYKIVTQGNAWANKTVQEFTFVLDKLKKVYSLPQYQNRFAEQLAKSAGAGGGPDLYSELITPVRNEVEGPVLVSNSVITEATPFEVTKARKELDEWVTAHANDNPTIRIKYDEMMTLLKLGTIREQKNPFAR